MKINLPLKMLVPLIFCFIVSICFADVPASSPIRCGEMPPTIYSCLGNPRVLDKLDVSKACIRTSSECEKISCVYRQLGWLEDGEVDKQKVTAHFEQFAKDHPEWSAAVQHLNTTCLASDLPAQGAHLNCPAYDIMVCSMSSFVTNAQPSQWSTTERCQYVKRFTDVCPLCPEECFAPLIPLGSCNACLRVPRSP